MGSAGIERVESTSIVRREGAALPAGVNVVVACGHQGTNMRTTKKLATMLGVGAVCLAALAPSAAHAEEVAPDGKGIVGGALLGGELVVFTEAIFDVRSTTAYLLGAAGGAVAGGVGGYFIEQGVDDAKIPAALLAGGLALVIPAIVITLNQTRYMPSEGAREDRPTQLPAPNPGAPGGGAVIGAEPKPATPTEPTTPAPTPAPAPAPAPTTTPPAGGGTNPGTQAPTSLFDVHRGSLRMGVPTPEVRPILGATERKTFGVENRGNEVRFPVVRIAF
jgi:hypothetical protein